MKLCFTRYYCIGRRFATDKVDLKNFIMSSSMEESKLSWGL